MIVLAFGSNLISKFGNRFKNIDLAISHIESNKIKILNKSSYYETPSYPNKKNPKFINVVATFTSNLEPDEVASIIISIEKKMDRKRNFKNGPRTCDIDIIDFNGMITNFKYKNLNFTVPHKNLSSRNFVLYPLKEILPEWKHPKTNESIDLLIDKLSNEDKNSILKVNKS